MRTKDKRCWTSCCVAFWLCVAGALLIEALPSVGALCIGAAVLIVPKGRRVR